MARVTENGRQLRLTLLQAGYRKPANENMLQEVCSQICRAARTYALVQERECNGHQTWDHKWDEVAAKADERKGARLEERMTSLIKQIDPRAKPVFNGDPRGFTVNILVPKRRRSTQRYYNTMGGPERGIGVPGS